VLRMRYAVAPDASRKSTWIEDRHPPDAAKPRSARLRVGGERAQAREVSRARGMDDRCRMPGGEGSPRALCDRDSSTPAQGVGAEAR
jgi:hypothetical protein